MDKLIPIDSIELQTFSLCDLYGRLLIINKYTTNEGDEVVAALDVDSHEKFILDQRISTPPELTATEALFGFAAYLTTRSGEPLVLSAAHDSAPIVQHIKDFVAANNLKNVTAGYPDNIKFPD